MANRPTGIPPSVIALIATLLVVGLTAAKIGVSESSAVILGALALGGFCVHRVMVMSDRDKLPKELPPTQIPPENQNLLDRNAETGLPRRLPKPPSRRNRYR
jgi:hypothetical protein